MRQAQEMEDFSLGEEEEENVTTNPNANIPKAEPSPDLMEFIRSMVQVLKERTASPPRPQTMDLPEFDGNFRTWTRFKTVFDKFKREEDFSALEILRALQKSLKGEAAESVSEMLFDEANIESIMERLEKMCVNWLKTV